VLRDREAATFALKRWCYRGSVDDWTYALAQGSLEELVRKYAPHLGKESFFDLM